MSSIRFDFEQFLRWYSERCPQPERTNLCRNANDFVPQVWGSGFGERCRGSCCSEWNTWYDDAQSVYDQIVRSVGRAEVEKKLQTASDYNDKLKEQVVALKEQVAVSNAYARKITLLLVFVIAFGLPLIRVLGL